MCLLKIVKQVLIKRAMASCDKIGSDIVPLSYKYLISGLQSSINFSTSGSIFPFPIEGVSLNDGSGFNIFFTIS